MKHVITLVGIMLLTTAGTAQIREAAVVMSGGEQNAFIIDLPKRDIGDIEKIWSKYVRDLKARIKDRDGEWFLDDAEMPEISDNTVDIYATFYDKADVVEMITWIDMGGVYMNSEMHPGAVNYLESWLNNFESQVEYDLIEQEVQLEEAIMEDLGKELDKLLKDEENIQDDILKYQEKIEEAKREMDQVRIEQAAIKAQIIEQEKRLNAARKKFESM